MKSYVVSNSSYKTLAEFETAEQLKAFLAQLTTDGLKRVNVSDLKAYPYGGDTFNAAEWLKGNK